MSGGARPGDRERGRPGAGSYRRSARGPTGARPEGPAPAARPTRERDRTRPPKRLGELLPGMASALGLDDEFQLARAMASWQRLVAERVPAAAGACEVLEIGKGMVVVAAREPIVAQELRLRSAELLDAFRTAPGGVAARELRVVIRRP